MVWYITGDDENSVASGYVAENDPFKTIITICAVPIPMAEDHKENMTHIPFTRPYSSLRDEPPLSPQPKQSRLMKLAAEVEEEFLNGYLRGALTPPVVQLGPRITMDEMEGPRAHQSLEPPFDLSCAPCINGVVSVQCKVTRL